MTRGRKPTAAMERPRWRCVLCHGPWVYEDEAFAAWQAHYIRQHMEKP